MGNRYRLAEKNKQMGEMVCTMMRMSLKSSMTCYMK